MPAEGSLRDACASLVSSHLCRRLGRREPVRGCVGLLSGTQVGQTWRSGRRGILGSTLIWRSPSRRKDSAMSDTARQRLLPRTVMAGALALGLVAGGYGVASAASGAAASSAATITTATTTTTPSKSA